MIKQFSILALFASLAIPAMGQASAKPEPEPKQPFVGQIGYKISYTGLPKERVAQLPDSMTLWSQPPMVRIAWHGGLADTLRTELHWDASQHQLWMIDGVSGAAWTIDDAEPFNPKATLKLLGKANYAGMPCNNYELSPATPKTQFALSDSIHFPYVLADSLRDSLAGRVPPFMARGKQTIPLRIQRTTTDGTVITQAVSVNRMQPDPAVFRMPSGYDIKPFDPLVRFHPLVPKPSRPD